MTIEEEYRLVTAVQGGDLSAQSILMERHYPFCFKVVSRYKPRPDIFMDLVQESVFGIPVAARKFEVERGVRFITYAYWWIRDFITNELRRERRYGGVLTDIEDIPTDAEQAAGQDQGIDLIEDMLAQTRGRLSLLDQQILRRYYRDEWTDQMIASAIGTSSRWVRLLRNKALEELKNHVTEV